MAEPGAVEPGTPVRTPVTPTRVLAVDGTHLRERPDRLVTEEPMEIRLQFPTGEPQPLAVMMRTPGHEFELAVGFCVTEGLLTSLSSLSEVAYGLDEEGEQHYNVVTLRLSHEVDLGPHRAFTVSSSWGLCGKTSLADLAVVCGPVAAGPRVARSVLARLPELLRGSQQLFDETGGLHAAACFSADGALIVLREDVGRHNALEKVIGHAFLAGSLPLSEWVLLVSGRISFEIVRKAAVAGIPVLCTVSAPSSLAVAAASQFGQTLVGFLRDDRMNVYAGVERLDLDA